MKQRHIVVGLWVALLVVGTCVASGAEAVRGPVTFQRRRNTPAPEKLNTVQGQLTDQQFRDVLTPGTELHQRWCAQVDAVAGYLKQLQEARVPVLWRPDHEMNGDWFWGR
jgi:hypothetical protein